MNELNVLKRICRHLFLAVLLCAVSAATASAQVPTVTVDAKNVTIKELLQRIEANSQYTFAYIDADINPDKRVSVKAVNRSIASIIAEVLPNVNMEVKGLKIVLTAKRGGESQTRPAADAGHTVKGRVTDESGAPVIGATVILKGTTVGTATNATGEYAIDIRQADAVLVYSLIGYNKVELALADNQTQADVTLKSEAIAMDNVVVVGYGVQNKRDVTTAISSIKPKTSPPCRRPISATPWPPRCRACRCSPWAASPTATFRSASAASSRPRRATTRSTSSTAFRATPGPSRTSKAATSRASSAQRRLGGGDLRFARFVRRHPHNDQARRGRTPRREL